MLPNTGEATMKSKWLDGCMKAANISTKLVLEQCQPINLIGVPSEVQSYMGKVFHLNNNRVTLM
jgi:hypothetical protein